MKQLVKLCFLCACTSLVADEEDCLCGTVKNDPDYARAVFLLNLSIRNTPFNIGANFPSTANEFYPQVELRIDTDDHFPFQGKMSWKVVKKCDWNKDYILKNKEEEGRYSQPRNYVEIPVKIVRKNEWNDIPDVILDYEDEVEYEHIERKVFDFQKDYGAIPQAFRILKNDITAYHNKDVLFLDVRIQDISDKVPVYEWGGLRERLTKRNTLLERKQKVQLSCSNQLRFTEEKEAEAFVSCTKSLDWCIANHHSPSAHLNRGLFFYLEGNAVDALDQVNSALTRSKEGNFEKLSEKAMLLKGQAELEAGLYADAVLTLSELINRTPKNKANYFERATAYFELGNFDLSLEDYLASGEKPKPISTDSIEMLSFSLGLTKGIFQGGTQAGVEFIPSLLSSLQGIAHGLWAFAQDPVQVSTAFVEASQACINFIKEHTPQETLTQLVPELSELIEKWDKLEDEQKGEITGLIIGKYGVDILAGAGLVKGMTLFRDLKRANNLLTFEAMAISERNRTLIKLESASRAKARQEIFRSSNLIIQWDKQGKHVQGHKNFEFSTNRSILEHADPQSLVNNFAGKGMRVNSFHPGSAGYQEIVDFKEFIGYTVLPETGEKIATSWGKIHYAKDGVHIVPTKPR